MGNTMNEPLLILLGATSVKTEQKLNKELSERIGATEKKLLNSIDKLTLDASKEREVLKMELCKQTRCTKWTEWSSCSANYLKAFCARKRSRKCRVISSFCSTGTFEKNETDYQICQGNTCKHTLTKNNYCIKLYKNVRKTRTDTKDDCHKDGGHLMNIDSALKARDIEDYIGNLSLGASIWIDGSRTLPNGDWKYEYDSKDTTFSFWGNGEPGGGDDCKVFGSSDRKWYGVPCTRTYYYLCEIV